MNVSFRVDASIEIGAGHVMRCLTLAEALREHGARARFLCRAQPGDLIETIRERGFAVDALRGDVDGATAALGAARAPAHAAWLGADWLTDARETQSLLADAALDWLIVDHYALDAQWERELRGGCRRLMVIDDLADRPHDCDLLLDQNLGRVAGDYENLIPRSCVVLAGPRYALLRPEFARLRAYSLRRRVEPKLENILVTMGGVDRANVTGAVLSALSECRLPEDIVVKVVMGPTAPWLEDVRAAAARAPWKTNVLVDVREMAQLMADSDLAIGAAGGTSWERCCLGLPTLVFALADNQLPIARALAGTGAAIEVELDQKGSCADLCRPLALMMEGDELIIRKMSEAASVVVDGRGTDRVVSCIVMDIGA